MRKYLAAVIVGLCLVAAGARVSAAPVTVTGKVIDLYCYTQNKSYVDMDHGEQRVCAWGCVKWEGQPVGIITADGQVYQFAGGLVANDNAKIAPHLAHTVTVTGEVTVVDGMPMISANDVTMVSK